MSTYAEFLARKQSRAEKPGRIINVTDVHPKLHPWQADLVQWAVKTSRAAIWADTGLGKTFMQIEWARLSGETSLIVAPLAVCGQTVREAAKIGVTARYVRSGEQITGPGVWVTNYEMVPHFDPATLDAVVLDEASILKQSDGKTRTLLIQHFADVPHRLACSATPAPNDPEELTNQAEFLGRMSRSNMLAAYFIHDSDGYRLKGHAKTPMMRWMAQWAVALTKPSDVGGDDTGYDLPGLKIIPHLLAVDIQPEDQLFATEIGGVTGRAQVRRQTLTARVQRAAELVAAEPDEPWVIWCGLNSEADALAAAIPGAVNVYGSMHPQQKADALLDFADGAFRVMVTKPSIASLGMNWQRCARMAFVGLSDSYQEYYQAIRRCYRYGQPRVVETHVILSELEGQIATNIARKEKQASAIMTALVTEMRRARQDMEVAS